MRLAYLAPLLLAIIAPGPDSIFAIGNGLGQGRLAAALSVSAEGISILALQRRS